jgi:hypothetical protein
MRFCGVLLACLLLIGCGTTSGNKGSDPILASQFPITPSITELLPASVVVDSVPFMLTVNGTEFGTDALVFWQGVPQSTFYVTSQQLVVRLTPQDLQFAGLIPVYVRTQGVNSNTVTFDVTIQ